MNMVLFKIQFRNLINMSEFDAKINIALKTHIAFCTQKRMSISRIYDRNLISAIISFLDLKEAEYDIIEFAEVGNLEMIEYLVEQGADIHEYDDEPLYSAAKNGNLDVIKYLVAQGADVNSCNSAALRAAAANGYLDMVKFLAEQGADIHANNGEALYLAACNGRFYVVKYLISQGANIYTCDDSKQQYPNADGGHFRVVKYLIEIDADIDSDGYRGALDHPAGGCGYARAVKYLVVTDDPFIRSNNSTHRLNEHYHMNLRLNSVNPP
jgi:ankyrin repeat protein